MNKIKFNNVVRMDYGFCWPDEVNIDDDYEIQCIFEKWMSRTMLPAQVVIEKDQVFIELVSLEEFLKVESHIVRR